MITTTKMEKSYTLDAEQQKKVDKITEEYKETHKDIAHVIMESDYDMSERFEHEIEDKN